MDGLRPSQLEGAHMNDLTTVEDLLTLNFLLYDIDIVDGDIVGELARRSVAEIRKHCATTKIKQPHMLREQH